MNYAQVNAAKYAWIMNTIKKANCKSIAIDDSQYLLANELFDRAYEKGYDKYTQMAVNFRNLIHFVNDLEDDNKIVYFLHHSEADSDGREKCKTIGKMLDEKLTIEGCFDIVLYCQDHKFFTQGNGQSSAKTPEGMFESIEIPNDLKRGRSGHPGILRNGEVSMAKKYWKNEYEYQRILEVLDDYWLTEPDELAVEVRLEFLKANGERQTKVIRWMNPNYESTVPVEDFELVPLADIEDIDLSDVWKIKINPKDYKKKENK